MSDRVEFGRAYVKHPAWIAVSSFRSQEFVRPSLVSLSIGPWRALAKYGIPTLFTPSTNQPFHLQLEWRRCPQPPVVSLCGEGHDFLKLGRPLPKFHLLDFRHVFCFFVSLTTFRHFKSPRAGIFFVDRFRWIFVGETLRTGRLKFLHH